MPDPIQTPTNSEEGAKPEVKESEAAPASQEQKSLMDEATAEEKAAQAAEEKRLNETPDDKLSDEDKAKKADLVKSKQNVVPEKYEFKTPEGLTVDQGYMDKASAIMKKHGITQAAATELSELAAEQIKSITANQQKIQDANFAKFVSDLREETKKELGANYKQELAFAAKTRDRLASPGLIDKLNKSGLADDIDVVKHFIAIGKAISEGKFVEGKSAGSDAKDELAILYPSTAKK